MSVEIHTFVTGPLQTNTYVVASQGACWIVDPGAGAGAVISFIGDEDLTASAILLTHGHGDHIAGAAELKTAFADLLLLCPAADAAMLDDPQLNLSEQFAMAVTAPPADRVISPGDQLILGDSTWLVLDTGGHTAGGVSFSCRAESVVIVGDSLFAGSIGRTDLPGASPNRLMRNIRENLLCLPSDTRVLTGHGPQTTIGEEKRFNPFVGSA